MTYIEKSSNKYNAISTQHDGITYHSKFEAGYAAALDMSLKAKEMASWGRQVKLELKVNGQFIANYYIDFIVTHLDGTREFVEVKGLEMPLWRMQWKILETTFDEFRESPDDFLTVIKQSSWGPPRPRK